MEHEYYGNMDATLVDDRCDDSIFQTEEKHGSDWHNKLGAGKAKKDKAKKNEIIFYGPWGGCGGQSWNDESWYTGVRNIIIMCGSCIDSIRVIYDVGGIPVPGQKHGGDGGYCKMVNLQYPKEYLIGISGYYARYCDYYVVRSLTFISNMRKFGPYGIETGKPFSSPIRGGKIVGFAGSSGDYLVEIGIYVSTA